MSEPEALREKVENNEGGGRSVKEKGFKM